MSEPPVQEVRVEPDHFDVVNRDVVLVARLESTFALCLYDAVLESGALVHLRVGPPGRVQDPELTDTTLSTGNSSFTAWAMTPVPPPTSRTFRCERSQIFPRLDSKAAWYTGLRQR